MGQKKKEEMEVQGKGWLGGWEEKQIGGLCSVSPGLVI